MNVNTTKYIDILHTHKQNKIHHKQNKIHETYKRKHNKIHRYPT